MKKSIFLNYLSIFVFMFLASSMLHGQSINDISMLDPEYLESLPESVRKDLEDEIKKTNKDETNTLKIRPTSELNKYQVVQEWEQFKKQRDIELYKSERYGINLFRTMQSSFMPINEPNFGNNYILDYGDVILINTYGTSNEKYELEIKRDGSISIPGLGPLMLAGHDYQQGVNKITAKFQSSFVGVNVDVDLANIRDIKILITGNIEYPGIYTLSGNSNLLQAINIAGGVNENGTLRNIEVKRNGLVIDTVDLYQALIFGDLSQLGQLQSGDSVYIKPADKLVRAGSGFVNEALFELKENEGLSDLLIFSGGIKKEVANKSFTLVNIEGNTSEDISINASELKGIKLNHLDSVYFPVKNLGTIKISGEVVRPGNYTINSGDNLFDIINRAGGYTNQAYPFAGILKRKEVEELESIYIQKSYQKVISFLIQNPDKLRTNAELGSLLEEFKNIEPSGRVVAEFDLVDLENYPLKRMILENNDEIHIPKLNNLVYVFGDVGNPNALSYRDFDNVSNYISRAGGINRSADKKHILIINPNGESQVVNHSKFTNLLKSDIDIYPGTFIYVPSQVGSVQGVEFYSVIAPIFSSLALSLASLNAINTD